MRIVLLCLMIVLSGSKVWASGYEIKQPSNGGYQQIPASTLRLENLKKVLANNNAQDKIENNKYHKKDIGYSTDEADQFIQQAKKKLNRLKKMQASQTGIHNNSNSGVNASSTKEYDHPEVFVSSGQTQSSSSILVK